MNLWLNFVGYRVWLISKYCNEISLHCGNYCMVIGNCLIKWVKTFILCLLHWWKVYDLNASHKCANGCQLISKCTILSQLPLLIIVLWLSLWPTKQMDFYYVITCLVTNYKCILNWQSMEFIWWLLITYLLNC